jgi:uncharacterized paraquat-inducible protein A
MWYYKIQTFLKSLLFHIYLGLPKANQAEIDYRYSICKSCDQYNEKNKECNQCGCAINQKKIFLNKLAWADQKCPLGKWESIKRK